MRETFKGLAVFLATIAGPVSCAAMGARVDELALFWIASALGLILAPLFVRRMRLLVSYIVLVGGGIAYLYVDYQIDTSQPDYDGSPGDGLAFVTLWIWKTSFVIGLGLRAAEHLWRLAVARRRTSVLTGLSVISGMVLAAFALAFLLQVVDANYFWPLNARFLRARLRPVLRARVDSLLDRALALPAMRATASQTWQFLETGR